MPHKAIRKLGLTFDPWIEALERGDTEERCLYTTVIQALVARRAAVALGAESVPSTAALLRKADVALGRIASKAHPGEKDWKGAVAALRKYNAAHSAMVTRRKVRKQIDRALLSPARDRVRRRRR